MCEEVIEMSENVWDILWTSAVALLLAGAIGYLYFILNVPAEWILLGILAFYVLLP